MYGNVLRPKPIKECGYYKYVREHYEDVLRICEAIIKAFSEVKNIKEVGWYASYEDKNRGCA